MKLSIQDNISIKGIETNCGSKILEGYKPVFNAAIIDRLEAEGMIIADRHSCGEFGSETSIKIEGDNSYFFKPTYGTTSRFGIIYSTSSLDELGVYAPNIDDCAAFFGIKIAEEDNLKIGKLEEMDMMPDHIQATYEVIACAETSSNLAKYDGLQYGYRAETDIKTRSEGFGTDVKKRILLGSLVLSSDYYESYYKKAMQARELIKRECDKLFEQYDAVISPDNMLSNLAGLPMIRLPSGLQLIGSAFGEAKLLQAAKQVGGGKS